MKKRQRAAANLTKDEIIFFFFRNCRWRKRQIVQKKMFVELPVDYKMDPMEAKDLIAGGLSEVHPNPLGAIVRKLMALRIQRNAHWRRVFNFLIVAYSLRT